jgi:myosin regulatory light chain 12
LIPSSSLVSIPPQSSHPRLPSTPLYTLFSPPQIKQFQEAFNLIDSDRDGLITPSDLSLTLTNLGLPSSTAHINSFLASAPSPETAANSSSTMTPRGERGISFTVFLTMMGEHLLRLDKEEELCEAFGSFDEGDEGVVKVEEMREWLANTGDRMSEQEVRRMSPSPLPLPFLAFRLDQSKLSFILETLWADGSFRHDPIA